MLNTNDDAVARIVAMAMDPDKDGEKYLFSLVRREREFTLGLSTLLACLRFAELGGGVPRISAAWWRRAASVVCDGRPLRRKLRGQKPVDWDPNAIPEARLRATGMFDHKTDPPCDSLTIYEFRMRLAGEEFFIGVNLVLTCLSFAEQQGAVPTLAPEWWDMQDVNLISSY